MTLAKTLAIAGLGLLLSLGTTAGASAAPVKVGMHRLVKIDHRLTRNNHRITRRANRQDHSGQSRDVARRRSRRAPSGTGACQADGQSRPPYAA